MSVLSADITESVGALATAVTLTPLPSLPTEVVQHNSRAVDLIFEYWHVAVQAAEGGFRVS